MQPAIKVKDLNVSFNGQMALDHINFEMQAGEYVGLIGPNGAGKSTLLQVIAGLQQPTSGTVRTYPKKDIGYISQKIELNAGFSISVKDVLSMGQGGWSIWSRHRSDPLAALDRVGMDRSFLDKKFGVLSGGQQQKVIIARSLIHSPRLLLFDEPLAGLDYESKLRIYDLLADLNTDLDISILFVSHEVEHITSRCKRILCLNRHLHEGCHPLDFAAGKTSTYETESQELLSSIRHEHKHC